MDFVTWLFEKHWIVGLLVAPYISFAYSIYRHWTNYSIVLSGGVVAYAAISITSAYYKIRRR